MPVKSLLYESKSNQITLKPPMLNHKAKLMCVRWTKTSLISPQQSHWRASSHPQTERYERDSDLCVHIDLCFTSNRLSVHERQHTCWENLTIYIDQLNWIPHTQCINGCMFVQWHCIIKSLALLTITEGSVFQTQYVHHPAAFELQTWVIPTSYVTFIEEGTQDTSTDHKQPKRPSTTQNTLTTTYPNNTWHPPAEFCTDQHHSRWV